MKMHLIILTLVILLSLGLAASAAASGPPWPAVVTRNAEWSCPNIPAWPAAGDIEGDWLTLPTIRSTGVYQEKSGVENSFCHWYIDFSDPRYMSWEEACVNPGYFGDLCRGNGAIVVTDVECISCVDDYCVSSHEGHATISKSGDYQFDCHFRWP